MASISRIRAAIGEGLKTIDKLVVVPTLPEIVNLGVGGAVVVGGVVAPDYQIAMGRGQITWEITLNVLCSTSNYAAATATLDELVNPSGDRSIPNYLWEHGRAAGGGLGVLDADGLVDLDIYAAALTAYGVEFVSAGQPHIGAVIVCAATTDARLP